MLPTALVRGLLASSLLATLAAAQSPASTTFTKTGYYIPPGAPDVVAVALGDLDGDGAPELLSANFRLNDIQVRGNAPLGSFPTIPYTGSVSAPLDVVVAQLDGANHADFAAVSANNALVVFLAGVSFPTFSPVTYATASAPLQVLAFDVDADLDTDLTVLTAGGLLQVFVNQGGAQSGTPGAFVAASVAIPNGANLRFAPGDFNGDGRADLVVSRAGAAALVLLNTSTTSLVSFAAQANVVTVGDPRGVTTGDFDGDGFVDFATADTLTDTVRAFRNLGPGQIGWPDAVGFAPLPVATLPTGVQPWAITTADFDCDGDLDLAVTQLANATVRCLWNTGAGTFAVGAPIPVSATPIAITTGDVDVDLAHDLAVADRHGGPTYLVVLTNDLPPGHCCHRFKGGIRDGFVDPMPVQPENTCPRPSFQTWINGQGPQREFDGPALPNLVFGHSLRELPGSIASARLTMRMRNVGSNSNDQIGFDFADGFGTMAYLAPLKAFATTNATVEFTVDLAKLPGGLNLLPRLQVARHLDIYLEDDTQVDFVELELLTCCPFATQALSYDHSPLIGNTNVSFTVSGAPANAVLGAIVLGTGVGCTPLPGLCLDGGLFVLAVFPMTAGTGTLVMPFPTLPPCGFFHTQAVVVDANNQLLWSCTISDQNYWM